MAKRAREERDIDGADRQSKNAKVAVAEKAAAALGAERGRPEGQEEERRETAATSTSHTTPETDSAREDSGKQRGASVPVQASRLEGLPAELVEQVLDSLDTASKATLIHAMGRQPGTSHGFFYLGSFMSLTIGKNGLDGAILDTLPNFLAETKHLHFSVGPYSRAQTDLRHVLAMKPPKKLRLLTFQDGSRLDKNSAWALRNAALRSGLRLLHVPSRWYTSYSNSRKLYEDLTIEIRTRVPAATGYIDREIVIHPEACPNVCSEIIGSEPAAAALAITYSPTLDVQSDNRPPLHTVLRSLKWRRSPCLTSLRLESVDLCGWDASLTYNKGTDRIIFSSLRRLEMNECKNEDQFFDWMYQHCRMQMQTLVYSMRKKPAHQPFPQLYAEEINVFTKLMRSFTGLKTLSWHIPQNAHKKTLREVRRDICDGTLLGRHVTLKELEIVLGSEQLNAGERRAARSHCPGLREPGQG